MLCTHQHSVIHISCCVCVSVLYAVLALVKSARQSLSAADGHSFTLTCVCNVSHSEFNVSARGCLTADSVVVVFNGSMRVFRWIMFMELQLKSFRSANRTVETVSDWHTHTQGLRSYTHSPSHLLFTHTHTHNTPTHTHTHTHTLTGTPIIHTLPRKKL